jgi:hypothetical protein
MRTFTEVRVEGRRERRRVHVRPRWQFRLHDRAAAKAFREAMRNGWGQPHQVTPENQFFTFDVSLGVEDLRNHISEVRGTWHDDGKPTSLHNAALEWRENASAPLSGIPQAQEWQDVDAYGKRREISEADFRTTAERLFAAKYMDEDGRLRPADGPFARLRYNAAGGFLVSDGPGGVGVIRMDEPPPSEDPFKLPAWRVEWHNRR